jgi:DNA (cytosine-5)-methyltransferase 1
MNFRALDLFAGAGGLSHGLNMVNEIDVVVANEYDKHAAKTHRANHKNCIMVEGDITDSEIKNNIIKNCLEKKVNLITGGIPCVAFSNAGKRDPFDPRGQLYKDYFEIVEKINPDVCVIENVKGLMSMKHYDENMPNKKKKELLKDMKKMKKNELNEKYSEYMFSVIDEWVNIFKKLGYNAEYKLLKASNFGVPQHRERVIIIASKLKNNKIIFPEETHNKDGTDGKLKWVGVKEAIDDLKDLKEDKNFSHVFRVYDKKEKEELIKQGKENELTSTQKKILKTPYGESYTGYGEANQKCHPDLPSNTVKENHGAVFVHYEKPRHMTVRELARLQSYPDDFNFSVTTKGQAYKQIGNAVPCLLGKFIGESIIQMSKLDNEDEEIMTDEELPFMTINLPPGNFRCELKNGTIYVFSF